MSEHRATISWRNSGPDFLKSKYSREHTWTFDGGITVPASPSPSAVPSPYSNPECVDPEEAFVAAIASCHMLTFLYLAYKQRFQIDSYEDEAIGVMSKNEAGVFWVSLVTLRPKITYGGEHLPSRADEERLHHMAHEQCFIANSVKTEVSVRLQSTSTAGNKVSGTLPYGRGAVHGIRPGNRRAIARTKTPTKVASTRLWKKT